MSLSGSQKAYKPCRANVARSGTSRLGWYQPWIKVYINGVDVSASARISGLTITDELNHEPNTASFRVDGVTPVKGQEVKIYMGQVDTAHQIYGGHILTAEQTYEGKPANVVWDCHCIDYTWLLNRRKVIAKYTSQSATSIITTLISTYTSGFTVVSVTAGLATIDEITFTNEDVTDAISRIMERIGGYWYPSYAKDIHAFLTDTTLAGSITDAVPRSMHDIVQSIDLSQCATRVTARGGGANAVSDVNVSGTTIPVGDIFWYPSGGGTVEVGQNRVTYTSTSTIETGSSTGFVNPPPSQVFYGGTGGSLTAGATYLIAWAYNTADGTAMAPTSSVTLGAGENEILTNTAPVPTDPKVTGKSIYLSTANGAASTMKKFSDYAVAYNALTIINSAAAGANAPTSNTAGFGTESTLAGSTTLQVEDLSQFPSAGWAEAPGGQVFSYTGRSASSGAGTLTGIPASGVGSLTAAVRAGTVKAVPHLTGCSGITYAINNGDQVNVVVTVNDTTAQTAMAGFVGGDGIHEMFISDGRWSLTEATARANAELTMRKDPITTIRFHSRDQTLQSGRNLTITITTPSISGTFKIQRVTITDAGLSGPTGYAFPTREVECSSTRFSFEDLLRQIKGNAA